MKQALQLRLGQQLTMTPQLQQAIRLLQLPAAELNLEIREALESNLMLETDEEATPIEANLTEERIVAAGEPSEAPLGTDAQDASAMGESLPEHDSWPAADRPSVDIDTLENTAGPTPSLTEHLHWQLNLSGLTERDLSIADAIIDAIAENGYLSEPLEEIATTLPPDFEVDLDELVAVLTFIQHLDPLGVAARSPQEALRIQLEALPEETPYLSAAIALVTDHLALLGQRQLEQLQRRLGIDETTLEGAIALIQGMDPHPGSQFSETRTEYVVPDCFVRRHNDRWDVEINPDASPRLRINSYYAGMIRRADNSADNNLLRQHLQEARWLIKSLHSRDETLLKVARCIVHRQQAFFEQGEEAMKPLVLREVAESIEMHESTVSRITNQKYMHTPQGTLEFKYFFSSHVQTADGGECSATAIRARIRRLIAQEEPRKPLSDSQLATILQAEGIHVARRTVAKYREAIGISSSTDRKKPF